MYGLVNKAVEGLVCDRFGERIWQKIKERAGVEEEAFISNRQYPDGVTYSLVGAASEVLDVPADQILEEFGVYWVTVTAQDGYGEMMAAAGTSLPDFLSNLPNFHARVSLVFPELKPPRFEISDLEHDSLVLHYHSDREGLQSFVVGLVRGLGEMFDQPATCRLIRGLADGLDHDEFYVHWQG